jgi:hypothetical protein
MISSRQQIYQIAYDADSLATVSASGFKLLDNISNERPDWFEYWSIRRFLLNSELSDDAWYGFFSPRFQEKTGLNALGVFQAIENLEVRRGELDVILFSPQPDMGAFFINVFEQGEMFHPGLMEISRNVLDYLGFKVPIETMVMDSRQIVFSNYFVAKAAFWRRWFEVTEAIFQMAEAEGHPLSAALNTGTSYRQGSQQKVFLVERIASLLLSLESAWCVASANTFGFAWSGFRSFNAIPEKAHISDALKMAFKETGHRIYLAAYESIRIGIGKD